MISSLHRYYSIYFRNNPQVAQVLVANDVDSVLNSNLNTRKETVFLVHGWNGHGGNEMNLLLREGEPSYVGLGTNI